MSAYPPPGDILEAASRFLQGDVAPSLKAAAAFNLRVTLNALDLVRREIALGPDAEARELARLRALLEQIGDLAGLREALCDAVASGSLTLDDPALAAHLRATAIDRLAIDQPTYSAYLAATANPKGA